ncbi:T9SS type A sorting domain-containing protein [Psychroserpens mesophilus]|uniref:T9SS type A sorting domain-containing protein n=1 Tax=Psychroserpens mesophilus TaxID=325473 RepID=UPI000590928B|nr:T9SS type A sorting domain-containing protein [Psychroserpens mesophilus]
MKRTLLNLCIILIASFSAFSQTTFAPLVNIDPDTGDEPFEIESGDLDGDGTIDLVMATFDAAGSIDFIKWYKNDGLGNFTIQPTISSTITFIDGLEVADIDGQFGDDIIVSSQNQNKVVYFLSDGAGGFGPETSIDSSIFAPGEVKAGDINLDGNMDIIVPTFSEFKTVWYAGDGLGGFAAEQTIQFDVDGFDTPYYVDIADYDDDGDLDVLIGIYKFPAPQRIEIYYNQYDESGSTAVSWIKDTQTVDNTLTRINNIIFADVNNDGQPDVVSTDITSGNVTWYNKIKNGVSTPSVISDASIITNPALAYVVDIDGDALNDVIVTDFSSGDDAIIWFKGNSGASPDATPTTITDNNFQMVDIAIADFDNDMDNDIASVGNFSDTVFWLANDLFTLGVVSETIEGLKIYPNPTNHILNISTNRNEAINIIVIDVVGKEVLRESVQSTAKLDVSQLQNGLYIIKFEGSDTTYKFIKQ